MEASRDVPKTSRPLLPKILRDPTAKKNRCFPVIKIRIISKPFSVPSTKAVKRVSFANTQECLEEFWSKVYRGSQPVSWRKSRTVHLPAETTSEGRRRSGSSSTLTSADESSREAIQHVLNSKPHDRLQCYTPPQAAPLRTAIQ